MQPCCRGDAAPEVHLQSVSNHPRHWPAFLKAHPPSRPLHIQQLNAVHCRPEQQIQRRPIPNHGNQIRLHPVAQGGSLPVLPDLGAERSHQVSKPIRAPRGWSIGTSYSLPTTQSRLSEAYTRGARHVQAVEPNKTIVQGVPHEILPDHEEAQPLHPYHAARGSGHLAKGVREVRVRSGEEPIIRRYDSPPEE